MSSSPFPTSVPSWRTPYARLESQIQTPCGKSVPSRPGGGSIPASPACTRCSHWKAPSKAFPNDSSTKQLDVISRRPHNRDSTHPDRQRAHRRTECRASRCLVPRVRRARSALHHPRHRSPTHRRPCWPWHPPASQRSSQPWDRLVRSRGCPARRRRLGTAGVRCCHRKMRRNPRPVGKHRGIH